MLTAEVSILIFVSDVHPRFPDRQVHKDLKDLRAKQDLKVLRVNRENKDPLVHKAKQDLKESREYKDRLEIQVHRVHKDQKDLLESKEKKDPLVHKAHKAKQDLQDPQGEQGPPGQGIQFGHLIVVKHVINLNQGNAEASDFIIHIEGNNQSPDTFPGSETGTLVTLGFGSYKVTEEIPNDVIRQHTSTQFSEDCSGVIHPDETKQCNITNIFNPAVG